MATTISGNTVTTGSVSATGSVSGSNIIENPSYTRLTLATFPNTTAYPNTSYYDFTLTEAQAPLGSYVIMACNIYSGSASGDQYAYLYQNTQGESGRIGNGIDGWYWYSLNQGIFRINTAADRAFRLAHATISASTSSDIRVIQYCGYISNN